MVFYQSILLSFFSSGLILQFDGSLRYPSDPGLPTSSLGRFAACAACIIPEPSDIVSFHQNSSKEEGIFLGGKILSADSTTSSGEVEYEGLLFGLEHLSSFLRENDQYGSDEQAKSFNIIVEGDCKNVIAQMNDLARPRKLENFHKKAQKYVETMPQCRFHFRHIPREENLICDRLSAMLISEQQQNELVKVYSDIKSFENDYRTGGKQAKNKGGKEATLPDILRRHVSASKGSYIPLSYRPSIYDRVASIYASKSDYLSVLKIGEWFQQELETLWPPDKKVNNCKEKGQVESGYLDSNPLSINHVSRDSLLAVAFTYQIFALKGLGRLKESNTRHRKKRRLLESHTKETADLLFLLNGNERDFILNFEVFSPFEDSGNQWPTFVTTWRSDRDKKSTNKLAMEFGHWSFIESV